MHKVLYLLGELNDTDVEWLIASGVVQRVPVGAAIIEEGQPTKALYIVLAGELAASVRALGGKEIGRLVCGAVAGEMSFIDGRPPSATVRAREDAQILAIPRDLLAVKLRQDTGFAARFYRALAIFLSNRLRGNIEMLSGTKLPQLDEDLFEVDEVDSDVMDTLFLAGQRFDRMLKRLTGG